ncbi:TatD family hydrolase [Belliella kenyensis]|uniref:TatD family hydrolase n=1 Tax=Belliella kenyensis TaxID=1472724 RepID=A0ABV8EQ73_9BACT|nr:TatD family hydrolase [Belliella kenyensis]MCH7401572.1 TatD family hydrolase [Belliella kenyensis]MDN3603148.1 TatD family hydrolase [Belliella kenyensis]
MKYLDIHTHHRRHNLSIYQCENISQKNSGWYSVGIHPWHVNENWKEIFHKISTLSSDSNLVAIGECGFDLIRGFGNYEIQYQAFKAQLELAHSLDLPVIMHQVKGLHLLQRVLKELNHTPTIIWHGYNSKPEFLELFHDFPMYFSFGSAIFREKSSALKSLKMMTLDRVFFETDNDGLKIDEVFERASLILQLPEVVLADQVINNWNRISKNKIDG